MSEGPAKEVKEKLKIEDVIKGYVELKTAGKNLKGLCPFHKEKTPSFIVSPDRQTWHCFGCGEGGDVFTFLMKHDSLEFGEALRILAEKAGVELRKISPMEYRQFGLLYDLNAMAEDFFKKEFEKSDDAKKYLNSRKINSTTLEVFNIGFAPNEKDSLAVNLIKEGHDVEDIIRAGLIIRTDRGMLLDRFRGRIMFPIKNHSGKTVGFTGRILPELDTGEMGKYVNSPETAIFTKSKILYGFSVTKAKIRRAGYAFLVEGQMDVLASWQAGIKNVVASSGTALTENHLLALKRIVDRIILGLDNDEAGLEALSRSIDMAEAMDFAVKVARFDPHKDPADAVYDDPENVKKAVREAIPAPEFYFDRYLPSDGLDFKDRNAVEGLRKVLAKLENIASHAAKESWYEELAKRTGLSRSTLLAEAKRVIESSDSNTTQSGNKKETTDKNVEKSIPRSDRLAESLLSAAVSAEDASFIEDSLEYFSPIYKKIYDIISRQESASEDPALDSILNSIILSARPLTEDEIKETKFHLKKEYIARRRKELAEDIRKAEASGDDGALEDALKELNSLPSV